jgi:uncharacterized membrane protein YdjX (TVP38/TMEM64 family)
MRKLVRRVLLVAAVLAVPIVPFLSFGPWMEQAVTRWLRESVSPGWAAVAVVGLLVSDAVLPVPSSVVTAMGGQVLGIWGGMAVAWLGMTLGALLGFALGRGLGRPLALRVSSLEDVKRLDELADRYGPSALVVARAVPVLAEASVLAAGASRLGLLEFLGPVAVVNLAIAVVFSALGHWFRWPLAVALAIAIPLAAAAAVRRWHRRSRAIDEQPALDPSETGS